MNELKCGGNGYAVRSHPYFVHAISLGRCSTGVVLVVSSKHFLFFTFFIGGISHLRELPIRVKAWVVLFVIA